MGKPLAFRRLREAVAEQQQRKQQQQQQGASIQDDISKVCSSQQDIQDDEPLAKRLKGEYSGSARQDVSTPGQLQGSNQSFDHHIQQATKQVGEVESTMAAQAPSPDFFNGKAALLHQAVTQEEAGSQLAEELQLLYRDPRFRVPAEQEEQVRYRIMQIGAEVRVCLYV